MKNSRIIKTLMRMKNNKSQLTLSKRFENFGTNLLKFCNKNILHIEAATRGCLYKQAVRKHFAKFTGEHLCRSLWNFIKKEVFLWILRNFLEHLFTEQLRVAACDFTGGCFWSYMFVRVLNTLLNARKHGFS